MSHILIPNISLSLPYLSPFYRLFIYICSNSFIKPSNQINVIYINIVIVRDLVLQTCNAVS